MLLITYFFAVVAFLAVRGAALTSTDVSKDEVRGMVTLDATTFSKIIPSDRHATIVMFINKASLQVSTIAREEYLEMVVNGDKSDIKDLLFSQVIINGAYNSMLATRVGITDSGKEPTVVIYEKGSSTPIFYPHKRITSLLMRKFASKHSNYYYPAKESIPQMAALVRRFLPASDEERLEIIQEAKTTMDGMAKVAQESKEYYIKCMEKVSVKGLEWAETEYMRLQSILESGKVKVADSIKKILLKQHIVAEFDRNEFMNPNRPPPALKSAKKDGAKDEGIPIDIANLKSQINAEL